MATPVAQLASELGAQVRTARIARGLTQAELAQAAQVGRQWLVGFELGEKSSAPLDMVMRLLAVLDLDVTLKPIRDITYHHSFSGDRTRQYDQTAAEARQSEYSGPKLEDIINSLAGPQ